MDSDCLSRAELPGRIDADEGGAFERSKEWDRHLHDEV